MITDEWNGCYTKNWYKKLHPDGIDHPAKISYQLIHKIYNHLSLPKGSKVLDPYAGVSCTAFHAMQHGYQWTGIEIEPKFVQLSQKNIDFWNQKYQRLPKWGNAKIINGDSTQIELHDTYDAIITSPPYEAMMAKSGNDATILYDANVRRGERAGDPAYWPTRKRFTIGFSAGYGSQTGNIGNFKGNLFWEMMDQVIENMGQYLKPGGIWVWVTKDLFRNRKRIHVADQIVKRSPFIPIHHHRAMLTENCGTYLTLDGHEEPKTIKRMSFFRYMVEKHYPENKIEWEDVICLIKQSING